MARTKTTARRSIANGGNPVPGQKVTPAEAAILRAREKEKGHTSRATVNNTPKPSERLVNTMANIDKRRREDNEKRAQIKKHTAYLQKRSHMAGLAREKHSTGKNKEAALKKDALQRLQYQKETEGAATKARKAEMQRQKAERKALRFEKRRDKRPILTPEAAKAKRAADNEVMRASMRDVRLRIRKHNYANTPEITNARIPANESTKTKPKSKPKPKPLTLATKVARKRRREINAAESPVTKRRRRLERNRIIAALRRKECKTANKHDVTGLSTSQINRLVVS